MRTVDPERYEAKRRHILAAAAMCFARNGFDATTVADICAAAEISSGSLFHYFPTKRAVFAAVFETDEADTAMRLAAAADAADAWAALLAEVDNQVSELVDPRAAGLAIEVIAQAGRDPEFAAMLVRRDRALRDGLAALVRRATEQGRIAGGVDAVTAADWVCGLIDAMFTRAGVDPEFDPMAQRPVLRLILSRFLQAADSVGGPP